jgi:hypothetical protein
MADNGDRGGTGAGDADPQPQSHGCEGSVTGTASVVAPPPLLLPVLAQLTTPDLVAVSSVCAAWHRAAQQASLWRQLDIRGCQSPGAWVRAFALRYDDDERGQHQQGGDGEDDGCTSQQRPPPWTDFNAQFCPLRNEDVSWLPCTLQSANLDGCRMLDDVGLRSLAQRCPELRTLGLYVRVAAPPRGSPPPPSSLPAIQMAAVNRKTTSA